MTVRDTAFLSSITIDPKTYNNKVFLTFDIDWAPDFVIKKLVETLEENKLRATIFLTHESKLLKSLYEKKTFEFGIHPNLNPLLNFNNKFGKNIEEVIRNFQKLKKKVSVIRSHSLTTSSRYLDYLSMNKFTHESNIYIPIESKIITKPFFHKNVLRVPHFFADDDYVSRKNPLKINEYLKYPGLKIFDFHPIHLYLNTYSTEQYENAKSYLKNEKLLSSYINNSKTGINDVFIHLISNLKS